MRNDTDPAVAAAYRAHDAHGDAPVFCDDCCDPAVDTSIAAAREALTPLRKLHRPVPVWGDDCDHEIDLDPYSDCKFEHPDGKHWYVEDIGWTCDRMYDICLECCTDDCTEQTEQCATYHNHGFGSRLICSTARLIYSAEELS